MSASLLERAVKKYGVERLLAVMSPQQQAGLKYCWPAVARPDQLEPPGDWRVWLVLAGRGWGKTRTAMEWVRSYAESHPDGRIALIARTANDVRNTILHGSSGLLSISPPSFMPVHNPGNMIVKWPNGCMAQTFSAEAPLGLRGPEFDVAVCDELAAWPSFKDDDGEPGIPAAWTLLQYGMRRPGARPRILITTTPKPVKVIKELVKSGDVHVTKGQTIDNKANLSKDFIKSIYDRYGGTRIGRQELYAELLDDVLGALWTYETIDNNRVKAAPDMVRIGIGVDPSGTSAEGNEQGIVVCGVGTDGHGYVLDDRTTHDSPQGWGRRVVQAFIDHKADCVFVERNFGGDMCMHTIQQAAKDLDVQVNIKEVSASRGKVVRAEPVSALYEQGRIHHVGEFTLLEEQMRNYTPADGGSPDRMDAMVWAFTELMLGEYVTLGEGPIVSGARRGTEDPSDDDDDQAVGRW